MLTKKRKERESQDYLIIRNCFCLTIIRVLSATHAALLWKMLNDERLQHILVQGFPVYVWPQLVAYNAEPHDKADKVGPSVYEVWNGVQGCFAFVYHEIRLASVADVPPFFRRLHGNDGHPIFLKAVIEHANIFLCKPKGMLKPFGIHAFYRLAHKPCVRFFLLLSSKRLACPSQPAHVLNRKNLIAWLVVLSGGVALLKFALVFACLVFWQRRCSLCIAMAMHANEA